MTVTMHQSSPVAHVPLVLGVVRTLNIAALLDPFCPPHPAPVLAGGRGVAALLLALLDGPQALSQVGARLEDRGRFPVLQPGLTRPSLHDDRLGQRLDGLLAVPLHRGCGAIALQALAVYAVATPWLQHDTTTIPLSGAYEEEAHLGQGPVPPRPASGHSHEGRDALKQGLLRLGVSRDGLPLRLGVRDGKTSDRPEPPRALEECGALGLDGVRGIVADSTASWKRPRGWCLERRVGLITVGPRTCAVRQEVEAWGQQHGAVPFWLEQPGRTRQEPPRRWPGQRVVRRVPVEYAAGRLAVAESRFWVVHSSQLAHQAAVAYAAAQATEAERVTAHVRPVAARWCAWAAEAEAAMAEDEGRGQGRRGRPPHPWRYHALHSRGAALRVPKQRTQRGRPPKTAGPQVAVRSRLVVHREACVPAEDTYGWTVLATTVPPEVGTETESLQAYQGQHITVEPGLRWIKHPAAIRPVWLENPARIAALAMLTVVGLLVSAVIQRHVRLYLREPERQLPGHQGLTATPTAAVVFARLTPVLLVYSTVDNRPSLQVHGVQVYHLLICDAVGMAQTWYQGGTAGQNALLRTIPP